MKIKKKEDDVFMTINNNNKFELHKPSEYPIYSLDYDAPERFYCNIYNYLYK